MTLWVGIFFVRVFFTARVILYLTLDLCTEYARAWTGMTAQDYRGNSAAESGNRLDPMAVEPRCVHIKNGFGGIVAIHHETKKILMVWSCSVYTQVERSIPENGTKGSLHWGWLSFVF
jgi:hypothetical protein